jgi:alpha-1,6-mannosyltransferase
VTAQEPLVVVTTWGAHGAAYLAALFIIIAVAGIAYARVLARTDRLTVTTLGAIVALALAVAWCAPALFSSDIYAYAAYGELARIGLNPYAHAPLLRSDTLIADAAWQWGGIFPVCVYGPAFVALAESIVALLAPFGTLVQLQGVRAIASAAFLLCVPLAYGAFSSDQSTRVRAAATIGLNPIAIWCAAEGHNDALALAIVLAGFIVAKRSGVALGAGIVALSALIKLPGLFAAAAFAFADRRARIGAAAGIVLAAMLSMPLLVGLATQLAPRGQYSPQASLQAVLAPLGTLPALVAAVAVGAALFIGGLSLLRRHHVEGWIYFGLAAWVLVPNPYPWYSLWLVALAALAPASRGAAVALALSFTSLLRYVPDAVAPLSPPASVLLGIAATLPLLVLVRWRSWYNGRLV